MQPRVFSSDTKTSQLKKDTMLPYGELATMRVVSVVWFLSQLRHCRSVKYTRMILRRQRSSRKEASYLPDRVKHLVEVV